MIPAGNYTVSAIARDVDGNAVFQTMDADVQRLHVDPGTLAPLVTLWLQELNVPAFLNTAPFIRSFYASAEAIVTGGAVAPLDLVATVVDGDLTPAGATVLAAAKADALTYEWFAFDADCSTACPELGTFDPKTNAGGTLLSTSPASIEASWTPPADFGTTTRVRIQLVVTDSDGQMAGFDLIFQVVAGGFGRSYISADVNLWPRVLNIVVNQAAGTGSQIPPEGAAVLTATVVDPDSTALVTLKYTWKSSCGGLAKDGGGVSTADEEVVGGAVIDFAAPVDPGPCVIGLRAAEVGDEHHQGFGDGSLALTIGTASIDFAPVIDLAYMTPHFDAGNVVGFDFVVVAHDPDGETLAFVWTAESGNLSGADTATPYLEKGSAWACTSSVDVQVVVSDATHSASTTFTVECM